jgi:hypothetical protein
MSFYKPSNKTLNYLMSLPQQKFSDGGIHLPSLFGRVIGWMRVLYAIFFIQLILETWTIVGLDSKGVDSTIMLLLVVVEIVVALIPILPEGNNSYYNMGYVNAQIFITKINLKYSAPTSDYNSRQVVELEFWEKQKNKILMIRGLVIAIILFIAYWKFNVYYGILKNGLFLLAIGRVTLSSIVLGAIVHTFITKIIVVDMLRNSRRNYEIKQFNNGNGAFVSRSDRSGLLLNTENINQSVTFRPARVKNRCDIVALTSFNGNPDTLLEVDNQQYSYSFDFKADDKIYLVYTDILADADVNNLVLQQDNQLAKETIANYGKQIQLSMLSNQK